LIGLDVTGDLDGTWVTLKVGTELTGRKVGAFDTDGAEVMGLEVGAAGPELQPQPPDGVNPQLQQQLMPGLGEQPGTKG